MKRPLAGVLMGYAGGILLGHFFQPAPALLWGLALATGLLALAFKTVQRWLLWPLLLFSGWASLVAHTGATSADDLRNLLDQPAAEVRLRGILTEPPRLKISEYKKNPEEHSQTALLVTGLWQTNRWQNAAGQVMIETPHVPDARFFQGQRVEINGVIAPPAPPLAEGLIDYRSFLQNKGIHFLLKTRNIDDWQLAPAARKTLPLTQRFLDWARQTLGRGLPAEDEPLRLIWAMALGWRTAFNGDVTDPFLQAGTMHLFAIDGLRIALVSGILITLLRVLRLSRAVCGLLCIPALWFYTAATGGEPSAIRASVMMTIVIGGWALNRPGDLLNSLAAAALVILVGDPTEMFAAGFQLSFLVVLIIALMLPPLNDWVNARCQFNPLVPDTAVPGWRKWGLKPVRLFLLYLALSFTAWIGSIPLSAKYFNLFSPISPLANVVAVPLGILTLMSIMGSLVCGAWLPWVTVLFNHSAWFFMLAMTRVSEFATTLPAAYYYVAAPSWPVIALYYLALVAGLTGWLRMTRRTFARVAFLTGLVAAVSLWLWHVKFPGQNDRLTVLPLGGAQVVFVDGSAANNQLLINCGNAALVDATLKPFLRAQGVNRLPRVVLTAGAADDSGGAARLTQVFPVDTLYASTNHFRSPGYRDFIAQFDRARGGHDALRLNDTVAGWRVLHPGPADHWPRGDDNALVLRGQLRQATILLLADLGRNGQSALLARTNSLRADIVIASIPSKDEPLCNALIHAIHPRLIVVADADHPASSQARAPLKKRLAATGIPVIYTRAAGAVTIAARPDDWSVTTMDGQAYTFLNASE